MNRSDPEITSRKVRWLSVALGVALLLALAAFFVLRGRITPLWVTEHPVQAPAR